MRIARPYQTAMIEGIYACWRRGVRRVLGILDTGGGKSFITSTIVNDSIRHGYVVIMAVKKRDLVNNLSDELSENGVNHAVYMAGSEKFDPTHPVQVCSIDTLRSRGDYPHLDAKRIVLIIDEAHDSKSPSFQEFIGSYLQALLLGVTATPYNGLSHFQEYVQTVTGKELVSMGYLVPFKIVAPKLIDDSTIPLTSEGEFNLDEVYKIAGSYEVIGDIVSHWLRFAEYRPTLLFAVNVMHSKQIAAHFNEAGIPARHIDADCDDQERKNAESSLKNGTLKVVCNVRLWTVGKNIPEIACIVDAALTTSLNLWKQKIGRGTRVNGIYSDCLLIDVVGNINRFGDPYEVRPISLSETVRVRPKIDQIVEKLQTCPRCFRPFTPGPAECPYCGEAKRIKIPRISQIDGQLTYLTNEDFERIEKLRAKHEEDKKRDRAIGIVRGLFHMRKKGGWSDRAFVEAVVRRVGKDAADRILSGNEHKISIAPQIIRAYSEYKSAAPTPSLKEMGII